MENAKRLFADRLRRAMVDAGYQARPAVLEREFNQRYKGKTMTLHGVRRWLKAEAVPPHDKVVTLSTWLNVPIAEFYASGAKFSVQEPRTRAGVMRLATASAMCSRLFSSYLLRNNE